MSRPLYPDRDTGNPGRQADEPGVDHVGASPPGGPADPAPSSVERSGPMVTDPEAATGRADGRSAGLVDPGSGPAGRDPAESRRAAARRGPRGLGGIKIGSAFFGWLTATGLTVLLVALVAAIGVGTGWIDEDSVLRSAQQPGTDQARSLGLAAGIVVLVVLFVAYLAGGYVAGRMARFKGIQQGVAVWLWGVVMSAVIAVVTAVTGYDALPGLDLPALLGGAVGLQVWLAVLVAVATALLGAIVGGLWGMRFHRRVDRALLEADRL